MFIDKHLNYFKGANFLQIQFQCPIESTERLLFGVTDNLVLKFMRKQRAINSPV